MPNFDPESPISATRLSLLLPDFHRESERSWFRDYGYALENLMASTHSGFGPV
jgi:hypothetical protein